MLFFPRFWFFVTLAFCFTANVIAQTAASNEEPPVEVELKAFRVESAAAPGGGSPWLRLLVEFNSYPAWADGIVFHYDVLVQQGETSRILSGTARYANVKRGRHNAVLYVSPSTAERFGAPVAASIRASYKDEATNDLLWTADGRTAPDGWERQFQRYPNQLMPITLTPFVATEYGKYPDALVPR